MAGGPQTGGIAQNPNINQMAAQGIKGAGIGSAQGMGYTPSTVSAGQLASTSMTPYMNPYTTNVIQANEADILRGGQLGLNELGSQANAARAFGGSRHGVATGEMGRNIVEQLAQSSAGLRQQGYQQAQQAALSDIGNRMNADQFNVTSGLQGQQQRLGAAGQLADVSNLGFGMGQTVTRNLAQQGARCNKHLLMLLNKDLVATQDNHRIHLVTCLRLLVLLRQVKHKPTRSNQVCLII